MHSDARKPLLNGKVSQLRIEAREKIRGVQRHRNAAGGHVEDGCVGRRDRDQRL